MYYDLLPVAAIILLVGAIGVFMIYYSRLKRVEEEYGKARSVVSDIITSFDAQLEKQEKQLATVAQRTESLSSERMTAAERVGRHDQEMASLANRLQTVETTQKKAAAELGDLTKRLDRVGEGQEEITKKLKEITKMRRKPAPRVSVALPTPRETVKTAIPIKKEKALAPLTETELIVLEILADEGGMTAPAIRERIELTREHTSRLMKKLYEDGYLERDTRKMPYVYRIKEEMLKILKKGATET